VQRKERRQQLQRHLLQSGEQQEVVKDEIGVVVEAVVDEVVMV
jgi:hypothetical protein